MLIKYIGNKPRKTDNVNHVFGRSWAPGSVLDVPDAEGERLLKFPTIWAEEKAGAISAAAAAVPVAIAEQREAIIDEVAQKADEDDEPLDPAFDAARAISAAPPLNETSAMGDYLDGFDVAQLEAMRSTEAAGKARGTMDKHIGYAIKRKHP